MRNLLALALVVVLGMASCTKDNSSSPYKSVIYHVTCDDCRIQYEDIHKHANGSLSEKYVEVKNEKGTFSHAASILKTIPEVSIKVITDGSKPVKVTIKDAVTGKQQFYEGTPSDPYETDTEEELKSFTAKFVF